MATMIAPARILVMLVLAGPAWPAISAEDEYANSRRHMKEEIAALARETAKETGRPAFDARVMAVIGTVPRHRFVPPGQIGNAYENRPLPIGYGQTISQPYIVALMTDLMNVKPTMRCSKSAPAPATRRRSSPSSRAPVCTIEIVEPLARQAAGALASARVRAAWRRSSVTAITAGRTQAPYDAIIVTAAASHVPPPLVRQLKPGGRMVIPVGPPFLTQQLLLVEKNGGWNGSTRQILPVAFVPLTDRH